MHKVTADLCSTSTLAASHQVIIAGSVSSGDRGETFISRYFVLCRAVAVKFSYLHESSHKTSEIGDLGLQFAYVVVICGRSCGG
jgi:hypothetical protein